MYNNETFLSKYYFSMQQKTVFTSLIYLAHNAYETQVIKGKNDAYILPIPKYIYYYPIM